MRVHELSDFTFLLRLGLWSGGDVAGIGYVTAARRTEWTGDLAGLTGFWLGGGVMLERSKAGAGETMDMTFSVFDPYLGEYDFFAVTAGRRDNMEEVLLAILKEAERERIYGPRRPVEYVSLHSKRKYVAQYSSMRGGTIPTTRRSR